MISQSAINQILEAQRDNLEQKGTGLIREALETLPDLTSHALIVSGVRRCGKSTLLFQLLKDRYKNALYLNFEDPRLYEFELKDFERLDSIIKATRKKVIMFDEIQIIPQWERYVRQKVDERCKVVITGSNASLLSRELGTKLTGRHISKELFPFSYTEFNSFTKSKTSAKSLVEYLSVGGFPEYVKQGATEILNQVFDDILVRDIAVRYGIRDVNTLRRLGLYLISNIAKPVTATRLKSLFDVGSTNTITEYLSHLEASYLLHLVPKFSYSIRKQLVNPRKVYAIDTGLVTANSGSFTDDHGRKFENLVYLHLRRSYKDIYYFSEKGECDFVVSEKGKITQCVQACYDLGENNLDGELNGLFEALELFKLKHGLIVTAGQEDSFTRNGMSVTIIPAFKYLAGE